MQMVITKNGVTSLYLSINDEIIGNIILNDTIKSGVKETISKLTKAGIYTRMFTGDNKILADKIGKEIGISDIKSEMLPEDKYNEIEKIIDSHKNTNYKVAFVGDRNK